MDRAAGAIGDLQVVLVHSIVGASQYDAHRRPELGEQRNIPHIAVVVGDEDQLIDLTHQADAFEQGFQVVLRGIRSAAAFHSLVHGFQQAVHIHLLGDVDAAGSAQLFQLFGRIIAIVEEDIAVLLAGYKGQSVPEQDLVHIRIHTASDVGDDHLVGPFGPLAVQGRFDLLARLFEIAFIRFDQHPLFGGSGFNLFLHSFRVGAEAQHVQEVILLRQRALRLQRVP